MKKLIAILTLLVASTTAFVGCSSGSQPQVESGTTQETQTDKAPLEDLLNQMIEAETIRMPMPVDEVLAKEAYYIDTEILEEYAIAETGISPGPGLIVMVKAKDGQLEAAKANMEKLLEARIGNAFYPAEQEAVEKAEILVDGNYVALFILNDEVQATAVTLFNESK